MSAGTEIPIIPLVLTKESAFARLLHRLSRLDGGWIASDSSKCPIHGEKMTGSGERLAHDHSLIINNAFTIWLFPIQSGTNVRVK